MVISPLPGITVFAGRDADTSRPLHLRIAVVDAVVKAKFDKDDEMTQTD
jgi:hypothetical protein